MSLPVTEIIEMVRTRHSRWRDKSLVREVRTAPIVMIRDVRVLDVITGRLSIPSCVLVRDGSVDAVHPATELPLFSTDHTVIDGRGGVLLPALTDFHVHIGFSSGEPPWSTSLFHPANPAREKESYIYAGVTTVVEGSVNPLPGIFSGREIASPNIFRTGRQVTARGGHPHPMIKTLLPWPINKYVDARLSTQIEDINTKEASIRGVLENPDVHHLKIIYDNAIPNDSPKLNLHSLRRAIELAHSYGKPAYVHVGSTQEAMEAAGAGADVLMHVPFVDKFSNTQVVELAKRNIVFVTTSQIWSWAPLGFEKSRELTKLEKKLMPPRTYAAFKDSWTNVFEKFDSHAFTEEYIRRKVPLFISNIDANIRLLHEGGVSLVAGTDTGVPGLVPGASLQYELQHLAAQGLPVAEVLRMATVTAGKLLSHARRAFGEVKPGYAAELILIENDPLEDLSRLEAISHVFTQGRLFQRVFEDDGLVERKVI